MKLLLVGDDNFTFCHCLLENMDQWKKKLNCDEDIVVEVAWCLSEPKIPYEYKINHDRLKAKNIKIHYNVNPALLRQYFPRNQHLLSPNEGPPYNFVLCILPGLSFDGCPRFIEHTSQLFQLRLHLYWFSVAKSSTVILKPGGRILYLWPDQDYLLNNKKTNNIDQDETRINGNLDNQQNSILASVPFPMMGIHKLAPFCKMERAEDEDFVLNLDWGTYKTYWKPIIHGNEEWQFPTYLEHTKVYVFKNNVGQIPSNVNPDDYNLLRIPHSICQWDRSVLPHVNELFHFSMRTATPGELVQVSKLSIKYDPRINGWRNLGSSAIPNNTMTNSLPPTNIIMNNVGTGTNTLTKAAPPYNILPNETWANQYKSISDNSWKAQPYNNSNINTFSSVTEDNLSQPQQPWFAQTTTTNKNNIWKPYTSPVADASKASESLASSYVNNLLPNTYLNNSVLPPPKVDNVPSNNQYTAEPNSILFDQQGSYNKNNSSSKPFISTAPMPDNNTHFINKNNTFFSQSIPNSALLYGTKNTTCAPPPPQDNSKSTLDLQNTSTDVYNINTMMNHAVPDLNKSHYATQSNNLSTTQYKTNPWGNSVYYNLVNESNNQVETDRQNISSSKYNEEVNIDIKENYIKNLTGITNNDLYKGVSNNPVFNDIYDSVLLMNNKHNERCETEGNSKTSSFSIYKRNVN